MARSTHLHRTIEDASQSIIGNAARRFIRRVILWASSIEPRASHRMGAWELHASNLARETLEKRR